MMNSFEAILNPSPPVLGILHDSKCIQGHSEPKSDFLTVQFCACYAVSALVNTVQHAFPNYWENVKFFENVSRVPQ